MDKPLDEAYFVWLYTQVGDPEIKSPTRTYWKMLKKLFTKEFVWIVPNDDNRVEDGKDLRYEFVDQSGVMDVDLAWINMGCSMLELLIGLSRRLSFETDREPRGWFWHLIENIGLGAYNDDRMNPDNHIRTPMIEKLIDEKLERVIWRTYEADGRGGLFPLKSPRENQRDVELWYQLSAYVLERT